MPQASPECFFSSRLLSGSESLQVEPVRLGGFRIIVLPGNGLVKVKNFKVLKKFPKKSGMFLDM